MKANKILILTIFGLFLSLSLPVIIEAQELIKPDIINPIYEPNLLPTGSDAVDFTNKDIVSDQIITFSSFAGKVIILDFFTTYDEINLLVMKELSYIKATYSSSKVVIMSIDIDPITETEAAIKNYTEINYIDWYVFLDQGSVISYYEALVSPTVYFITPEQKVHYAVSNIVDAEFMSGKIDEILPDDPPTSNPGGISDFWQNNWLWFLLGGIAFLVLAGLLFQRRRIVVHNKKVREEKSKRKQQRQRERNR